MLRQNTLGRFVNDEHKICRVDKRSFLTVTNSSYTARGANTARNVLWHWFLEHLGVLPSSLLTGVAKSGIQVSTSPPPGDKLIKLFFSVNGSAVK
jgi:hypothetical protein